MAKFKLAIGLHNHQPVGNFDFVFDESHRTAYEPFLSLLEKYPQIRLSLHQSGILWDWQENHYPEYLERVNNLIKNNQVELLTGGFYEPILISIPHQDSLGQIEMLNSYLKDKFNATPIGAWLTERIWEPHLPKLFSEAGVKFLPVDDTHFIYAGFKSEDLNGPYVTEFENKTLTLLPISKRMRYLIPFGKIEEVIDELRKLAEHDPSGMVIYADDGEKFGSWPNTYKHCYEDGWLDKFFKALSDNSDWLEVIPLGEAYQQKPKGRAYLPSASYAEMLHWSLPADTFVEYEEFEHFLEDSSLLDKYSRFVRGGHWRGFLTKYDEVNLMHKKMMFVSERLASLKADHKEKENFKKAADALYAGQCNCPYWHGVFGGLYLPHIRQAIYEKLNEALDYLNQLAPGQELNSFDYNADGFENPVYLGENYHLVFNPEKGGTLLELSSVKDKFNYTDTLTRRKEGYHLKLEKAVTSANADSTKSIHDLVLTKEEGLKDLLMEDWYLKRCFIDHIFTDDVTFENFKTNQFGEFGDFVLEPYDFKIKKNKVTLSRDGNLWKPDGVVPLKIKKKFEIDDKDQKIEISYELSSDSDRNDIIHFAVENNFNFQAGHAEDRYILIDNEKPDSSYLDSEGRFDSAKRLAIHDLYRNLGIEIKSSEDAEIWVTPLFTVSLSEGGFEKVYQGTTVLFNFKLSLYEKPIKIKFKISTGRVEDTK